MTPIGFLHTKEFNQVAVLLSALSVLSAAKIVTVPENYDGHFPWFLTKIETNSTGNIRLRLADDYNGTFGIEEQAFLFSLRTFDREQRDTYELQVNVTDPGGRQLEGPISITITVMDRNDNAPVFEEDTFLASVHMGAPAGYRILNIVATDLDDPLTPNGDLFYKMISQEPARPSDNMFQVNGLTGDLTLTAEGAATLDVGVADQYQLVVQVKDMGKLNKGNYVKADIIVNITENTWVPLSPVSVRENHEGPYPLLLSKAPSLPAFCFLGDTRDGRCWNLEQGNKLLEELKQVGSICGGDGQSMFRVQWNNNQVRYRLESRFPVDEGLFIIDERGSIYLTQPLDRELEAEYKLVISALDYDGELYDEPLELKVTVTDENDNTPVCSPEIYVAMVQEHEKKGTCVAKLRGEDEDDHLTENADLFFQLHKQVPQGPEEPLFTVDSDGVITLARDMIDYHSLTYHLLIHVSDLAGAEGGLSSTCSVIVHVDEWNDHSPVFSQEQYGPISVPEDADIGHEVITFKATDADLYMSEGWFVTYMFESGNEDQMFGIVQDGQSNVGKLILHKALDFETVSEYRLVVTARNSEELEGTDYVPSATTTVSVRVKDVNERPELPQGEYEVNVSWDTRPGSVLLKLEGRDPDVLAKPVRYRLRNESQQWLSVGADSGEVTFLGRRPAGSPQQLDVLVEDGDDPALFVVAHLVIHIEEVWEDAPGPLLEYSRDFLCTPRREEQVIAITVSHRTVPMTLSVDGQPLEQRKWKIHQRNDTLAFLSIGLSWVEPGVYQVVIALSKKGNATVRLRETLPVHICTCNSQGECWIEVEPIQGKPTILSAVSTTAGTLAVIGLSIIIALVHLSITRKQRKKRQRDVSIEATPLRSSA